MLEGRVRKSGRMERELKKVGDTFSEGGVRGRHEGDPEGDKVESVVVWCVQIDALILLHEKVSFFPSHTKRVFFITFPRRTPS